MSFAETVLLGALAGFTIFPGLAFGRLRVLDARARVALAMFAVAVLAFLFVEVFEHAFKIIEESVIGYKEGDEGAGRVVGLVALLAVGFAGGTVGLASVEWRLRPTAPPMAGGAVDTLAVGDLPRVASDASASRAWALRTGMTIAAAIGLHNFAEGLAIGVSASTGEIGLATVLIVGFALHNTTEGSGSSGRWATSGRPGSGSPSPGWSAAARPSSAPWWATTSLRNHSSWRLRRGRRRDPLRPRRGLERHAAPRTQGTRPCAADLRVPRRHPHRPGRGCTAEADPR